MKLSVVIPAYNESSNIKNIINEVTKVIAGLAIDDYEIIIIDDHSGDGMFELIQSLNNKKVSCYRLSRNSGSHVALRAGLFYAQGDAVLCLAADGQDDPDCLGKMLEKWRQGIKIVWALRENRDNESFFVKLSARIFYKLILLLVDVKNNAVDLSRADFYLLDRAVVNAINACHERNTSLFGLIAWLCFSQDMVEYSRRSRVTSKSKWTFKGRVRLAKDWIIAFSGIPLKFASYCGIIFALGGFSYAFYIIIQNVIFGSPVPGWASIFVAIFITSGVQMFIIGVIGEYLWRNLDETRCRPLYFIESVSVNGCPDKKKE